MPLRIPVVALALVLGLTCAVIAVGVRFHDPRSSSGVGLAGRGSPPEAARGERFAVGVLHAWDARRAQAWATGDTAALSALYTPGSTAGAADTERLRRYTARGLVLQDMRIQVLRARVLVASAGRLELEVTDRLDRATAVRANDETIRRRLPAGGPGTRELVLRRVGGQWLMARVSKSAESGRR